MGADCSAFALIPLARPEMTSVAVLPAPRSSGAVLMPLIIDDSFYDFARENRLPDCSVSFLMRAGSWSARTSHSGFVPNSMLADFSDDPDQATRALLAAKVLRRVKAGVRITDGCGLAVVNARDVSRDIARERAEAEERRARWRGKKQRQRAGKQAEQHERIASGVPVVSRETNADVPPKNPGYPKKPQVTANSVPGDIAGTSPGTTKTTASDYQDQSVGVNQVNAGAREAPSPGTLALVVAGLSKKLKRVVTEAEACRAVAEWDRRAEAAGEVIHDPEKYYPTCIKRERDLEEILVPLLPAPPPEWLELGQAPNPAPGAHLFEPSPDPFDAACSRAGCGLPEKNTRIHVPEAKTG